jgi:hypothetical protein
MAIESIGTVRGGRTRRGFEVKWDPIDRCVYVCVGRDRYIGRANSPAEAMRRAEAFVYDR